MQFKFILGVDISKGWFHFCLMNTKYEIIWEGQIDNNPDDIFRFLTKLSKQEQVTDFAKEIIVVMEHTGVYVQHLVNCCLSKGGRLSIVHANKVSDLLGGKQGWDEKTDPMDACRLAEYGIRFNDKLELWQAKDHTLVKLQALQRQRTRLTKALNILEVPINESVEFDVVAISEMLVTNQDVAIQGVKQALKIVEEKLFELIKGDPVLTNMYDLIISIPGVGPVTARDVIITTSAFSDFDTNQAKQYARYCAVIPKDKSSGKVNRKKKTTKLGNKNMRSLLTTCAMSILRTDSELKNYYYKKRAEGKHHLSVINAMRNKLILRIFAVVRNQVTYQKNMNMCLDLP